MKWLDWVTIAAPRFSASVCNSVPYAVKTSVELMCALAMCCSFAWLDPQLQCVNAVLGAWSIHRRKYSRKYLIDLGCRYWGHKSIWMKPQPMRACPAPLAPWVRQCGAGATGRPVIHRSEATMLPSSGRLWICHCGNSIINPVSPPAAPSRLH